MNFLDSLSKGVVLADGAMGTMLHSRIAGDIPCFDELNLLQPAVVAEVHREYIEAGAQMILTNTFGSNRYKLEKHGLEDKVTEINSAAVELAKRAVAASFKDVFIAGDVGPLGVRIAPYGRVQPDEARAAFAEQIKVLADAGADLIVIETISDLHEIREAINAASEVCDLPVVASITFTRDGRTLLGDHPITVAKMLAESGANVIGVNCSGGPTQLLRLLKQMRPVAPEAKFWVKPNAGWPEQVGGRIMYPADADYFGDYAVAFCEAGASVVGGCCGTTPAHVASMRAALDKHPEGFNVQIEMTVAAEMNESQIADEQASQLAQRFAEGKFSVAVEMSPPRGLSTHKLIAGASLLADAGADVIDVADSPMARMRMSAWAVCDVVRRQVGVDTTLHFPTRGRNLLRVQGDLLAAHALGIRNVFVVMGDPTSIGDYPEATDNYDLVPSGLIKLIKQGFNTGVDHSGTSIGQPTNFFVAAALNLSPKDREAEAKNLRRKLKAGADFFLTQPVYQPDAAREFIQFYENEHGPIGRPIMVGILPLVSTRHARFLHHEVPGVHIPDETLVRMEAAGELGAAEGAKIAIELIGALKEWAAGVYLMPQFHRYDMAAEIIEAVK